MATGVTVRMVHVKGDNEEISRAQVHPDNTVTYSQDDDMLPSLFDNVQKRHPNLDLFGVAKLLNKDGWSNGYIMIAREQ